MIYEYINIFSLLLLSLILLFTIKSLSKIKIKKTKKDSFQSYINNLISHNKLVAIFIFILIISRFILFIITPTRLIALSQSNAVIVYFLLTEFLFFVFWTVSLFLYYLVKHIKIEDQKLYLKKVYNYVILISSVDLFLSVLLLGVHFNFYNLGFGGMAAVPLRDERMFFPFLIIIGILLLISFLLFTLFIYKRSLKMLKHYWLTVIFLFVVMIVYWIKGPNHYLGLYDMNALRLKVLSWHYGYLGWIVLLIFAVSIFCNISAFIIFSLKDKIINMNRFKYIIISYIKTGFISQCACVAIVVFPHLLNLIY